MEAECALHVRVCIWHYDSLRAGYPDGRFLRSALLQVNYSSIFISCQQTLKIRIVSTVPPGLLNISVGQIHEHFKCHCPLHYIQGKPVP